MRLDQASVFFYYLFHRKKLHRIPTVLIIQVVFAESKIHVGQEELRIWRAINILGLFCFLVASLCFDVSRLTFKYGE